MISEALHTIPLLRLFPGLPRRTFSSFTCFFGGILLFAYARPKRRDGGCERRVIEGRSCDSNAGPAAIPERREIVELKTRLMRREIGVLASCDTNVANWCLRVSEYKEFEVSVRCGPWICDRHLTCVYRTIVVQERKMCAQL
jgi:hypothetical protein